MREHAVESWQSLDFARILSEFQPKLRNYGWMGALLRARIKKTRAWPLRLHKLLCRFGDPKRPFFIGKTFNDVLYLGDYRDFDSMMWFWDEWNQGLIRTVETQLLKRPSNCMDIGANMGIFTATMARQGQRVTAFEPVPLTASRAAATLALNGVDNVQLIRGAVGRENGTATIAFAHGHSGGASLAAEWSSEGSEKFSVPVWSIDSLRHDGLVTGDAIQFLKIDVEGFEYEALSGASQLIRDHSPTILYEYNEMRAKSMGWSAGAIENLLNASSAYSFQTILAQDLHPTEDDWEGDILCSPVK